MAHDPGRRPGSRSARIAGERRISSRTAPRPYAGSGIRPPSRCMPGLDVRGPVAPHVRADRHRSRGRGRVGGDAGPRAAVPDGSEHLGVAPTPRRRVRAASRRGSRSSAGAKLRRPRPGWRSCRGRWARSCRTWCRGSGPRPSAAARRGSTTRRTPDQDARRAVRRPSAERRPWPPRRSAGRSWTAPSRPVPSDDPEPRRARGGGRRPVRPRPDRPPGAAGPVAGPPYSPGCISVTGAGHPWAAVVPGARPTRPRAGGEGRGFHPVRDVELGEDVRDVDGGGARADPEVVGDPGVRPARGDTPQDLALAGREAERHERVGRLGRVDAVHCRRRPSGVSRGGRRAPGGRAAAPDRAAARR